jgi:2-polyprenyl-3-methyl-5-hydroxy-6-metoxy-1,4-benzoquinol methylase
VNINDHVSEYYQNERKSISRFIKNKNNKVFDIGCASGNFGLFLKNSDLASKVIGVDIDSSAVKLAKQKIDEVYCVNLNQTTIQELIDAHSLKDFDYVVCADVLEHLIDPWSTLTSLTGTLKKEGRVVASIPNIRHWTVLYEQIFKGNWEYQKEGIMDKTHLRFFTKKTMIDLFEDSGLDVEEIQPLIGGKWKTLNKIFFYKLSGFLAIQWVLVGKKNSSNA